MLVTTFLTSSIENPDGLAMLAPNFTSPDWQIMAKTTKVTLNEGLSSKNLSTALGQVEKRSLSSSTLQTALAKPAPASQPAAQPTPSKPK